MTERNRAAKETIRRMGPVEEACCPGPEALCALRLSLLRRTRVVLRRFAVGGPFSSKKTDGKRAFSGASGIRRVAAGRGGRSRACRPARARMRHSPRRRLPRAKPRQAPAPGLGRLMGRVEPPAGLDPPPRPPSPGVSRRPSGARAPVSAPVSAPASAARCSRRTGVSPGGSGRSATTSGTMPARRASSMDHRMSSGRVGSTKIRRPGSISWRTPLMCSRSGCQPGRIHRIVPSVPRASHSASRRRAGPQTSCARPPASRNRPRSGTAGRSWRYDVRVSRVRSMAQD